MKVAFFVEHAVVRQEVLAIGVHEPTARNHRSGVVDIRAVGVHEADDDYQVLRRSDDFVERLEVVADEVGLEQQVFGRVTGECEFGKRDEVGGYRARATDVIDYQIGVAHKIADRRIDLSQCYSDGVHD